jgi:hypothetical protein
MHSYLFLTIIVTAQTDLSPVTPPAQERLVPIPQSGPPVQVADKPVSAELPRQDVVLFWNDVLLKAIRTDRTPPPRAARNLAIVHAAIYDAVVAIDRSHRPFRVDARVAGEASLEAAVAVAAHRTLMELYPRQVEPCDAALDASLQMVADGPAKRGGVALGQHVAEKILAWRANDGANRRVRYTPRVIPGLWRPTPPGNRAALLPQWRYLTPFAIPGTARFVPVAPPTLNSAEYTEAFHEVRELGGRDNSRRTAEQTLIAWFWDDGEGSVTPPGHWNQIAQSAARQRGLTPSENARLFALLNVSLADAAIVCWEGKFGYSYWRPITAIREADLDDNPATTPDRAWQPLLTTPPFPSYASGHSTFSGAAATALASFFGSDAIRFTLGSEGAPGATRTFAGFWAAAQEAGRSRIYGGIHYEFDNREGLRTGHELADYIARHYFRPLRERALTQRGVATSPFLIPANRRPFSDGIAEQPPLEPRAVMRGR